MNLAIGSRVNDMRRAIGWGSEVHGVPAIRRKVGAKNVGPKDQRAWIWGDDPLWVGSSYRVRSCIYTIKPEAAAAGNVGV